MREAIDDTDCPAGLDFDGDDCTIIEQDSCAHHADVVLPNVGRALVESFNAMPVILAALASATERADEAETPSAVRGVFESWPPDKQRVWLRGILEEHAFYAHDLPPIEGHNDATLRANRAEGKAREATERAERAEAGSWGKLNRISSLAWAELLGRAVLESDAGDALSVVGDGKPLIALARGIRSQRDAALAKLARVEAVIEALPRCSRDGCDEHAMAFDSDYEAVCHEHSDTRDDPLPWADALTAALSDPPTDETPGESRG